MPKKCEYCSKLLNKLQIGQKQRFCSRECKSLSQIRRISVNCDGCGNEFSKKPCFKRHFNYCTLDCYWNSTRRKQERYCKVCGKKFWAKKPLLDKGFGIFCSRKCQHKTYPEHIKKICPQCRKVYYTLACWAPKRTFCSKKCQDDSMRDYVSRICKKCGKKFDLPRGDLKRGRGKFCTYRCYLTYRGPSSLEEKMERTLKMTGVGFKREVKFKRFHVDFLIEKFNSVIECDGEFWHLPPKMQNRDRRKDLLLKSLGYQILRFSGKEMDKYSESELSNIVSAKLLSSSIL